MKKHLPPINEMLMSRRKEKNKSQRKKHKVNPTVSKRAFFQSTPSGQEQKFPENKRKFLSIIRSIVSIFNKYYALHYLTVIIVSVLVIFTGRIFKPEGLVVASILLIYIIVHYLDKWLKNLDDN